jgi:hypothetical protein
LLDYSTDAQLRRRVCAPDVDRLRLRNIRAKRRGSVFSKARTGLKAESKSTLLLLYLRENVNEQDKLRADKSWRDTLM